MFLAKKRGTPSQKRGISTDKVCLITGIERDGDCFMRVLNMGRPSIEDIKDYGQHIVQKTYLWTDGLQSYSVLSTEKAMHDQTDERQEAIRCS